jgi:hypothetical protein
MNAKRVSPENSYSLTAYGSRMATMMAVVRDSSVLLSWNFKHIVHFQKVPLYDAVNRIHGYPDIAICTPQEAIDYDEETIRLR